MWQWGWFKPASMDCNLICSYSLRMRKVILAIFISLTVIGSSQDRGHGIVLRPSGPAPHWDKGAIEGRTYRNASLGVELTPPPGLEFGAPELKGESGTLPLVVTIAAVGEDKLHTTRSKVMAFYSDALAYYRSTRRSTDAYMLRVVRSQRDNGYEPVAGASNAELGGFVFVRQDFKKGDVYERILAKACNVQAVVFIFGGADKETVDSMNAEVKLKLDPHAQCNADAATPARK